MTVFSISDDRLRDLAQDALNVARSLGASDASCEVSEATGLSVTVRKRKVETIEHTRDKGLGVTVYLGQRRGHASTSDFSTGAVRQAVEAAHNIARFTAEDDAAGLPDEDTLERNPRDVDLFHPWLLDADEAIRLAQRCESAAFAVSPKIVNSEGANVYTSSGHFVLANTRDFLAGYPYSRHSISVSPIARDASGMQRDDWYSSTRLHAELASPEAIGDYAAHRALARLGARKLATRQCPVLFEAPLACGLLGNFVQAASGGALYRKSSFLVDSLGEPVFAPHVSVEEDPYLPRGAGVQSVRRRGRTWYAAHGREGRAPRRLFPLHLFGAQARHEIDRQCGGLVQPDAAVERHRRRGRLRGHAAPVGNGAAGDRADRAGRQLRDGRLLARCQRLLGRGRTDLLSGRGNHDRRQPDSRCSRGSPRSAPTRSSAAARSAGRC